MTERIQPIENVKKIVNLNQETIGFGEEGGLVNYGGKIYLLRHPNLRFRNGKLGDKNYFQNDLEEVTIPLGGLPKEMTTSLCQKQLIILSNGKRPETNTFGAEIEGCVYNNNSYSLLDSHDEKIFPLESDKHPELNRFTLEVATGLNNGTHLNDPISVAREIGITIDNACEIVEKMGGKYVLSSVPEGGNWSDGTLTPHPYLLAYAPFIKKEAASKISEIPPETESLYKQMGVNIIEELQNGNDLNWPMQSLHVHTGLPIHGINGDKIIDTRVALINAKLLNSQLSKIISFTLFGTKRFYGIETDLSDVRSIAKKILHTTRASKLPNTHEEYMFEAINQLKDGLIPSISRYPKDGQHGNARIRPHTVESIGYPINPDLRLVVNAILFQEVLGTLAKEALVNTEGDEIKAMTYLRNNYGSITEPLDDKSDFELDVLFNRHGFGHPDIRKYVNDCLSLLSRIGQKYKSLEATTKINRHVIASITNEPINSNLNDRLGLTSNGSFLPTIRFSGIVSDYKNHQPISELVEIQHNAIKQQSAYLKNTTTEAELLEYFGL